MSNHASPCIYSAAVAASQAEGRAERAVTCRWEERGQIWDVQNGARSLPAAWGQILPGPNRILLPPKSGDEKTRPNRAERSRSSQRCKEEPWFCFYLHQLLFLLLTGADGVSEGAHLRQDGLRLLQLVAIRAVGDLLVDPGGQREESRKKGNLEIKNKETFP